MKEIQLTKGYIALVDDSGHAPLAQYQWRALTVKSGKVYAYRNNGGRYEYMHRVIMGLSKGDGVEVDHVNGNALDNRRENLRICSHKNNLRNQKKQSGRSSQFKGVTWFTAKNKWCAGIKVDRKRINLGLFVDEEVAARAYDQAAITHFGQFANTNFPAGEQPCA